VALHGLVLAIRGIVDRLFGGVGMRRGRRDSEDVRVGDALDFWRVEAVDPGKMMRLRAEMKVPGRAWLEFQAEDQADSGALSDLQRANSCAGTPGDCTWQRNGIRSRPAITQHLNPNSLRTKWLPSIRCRPSRCRPGASIACRRKRNAMSSLGRCSRNCFSSKASRRNALGETRCR
jgi:hypothetical protein